MGVGRSGGGTGGNRGEVGGGRGEGEVRWREGGREGSKAALNRQDEEGGCVVGHNIFL